MKWEKPMFFWVAQPNTELHSAPLWEMKARLPDRGAWGAKLAWSWAGGQYSPMELGPR